MAVTSPITINVNGTESKRTWRVELFTELSADYEIRVHREEVILDDQNELFKRTRNIPVSRRKFSSILTETVTLSDGVTELTGQQIAEAIQLFADKWAVEDEQARAAAEGSPEGT